MAPVAVERRGLQAAWPRVIGLVVQPGVEFDHHKVIDYVPPKARELSAFPQTCLREDRASSYEQWSLDLDAAMQNEYLHALESLASGEAIAGATRFSAGAGRHGARAIEE